MTTLSFFFGCGKDRSSASMQAAISHAISSEPFVTEFDRLYPNSEHFITYYTGNYGDPIWNSKIAIDSRTELTMQFDIDIDKTGRIVTRTTAPKFHILTTKKTTPRPDGSTLIEHGPGMEFDTDDWKKVVATGGDISVIFDTNW